MRSGLVWFGARSRQTIPEIDPLVRALRANHPKADVSVIGRACRTAEKQCHTQVHKSGEPYITHPVTVVTILAEMRMTAPTLVTTFLHDTVEDTNYTLDQLRAECGDAIAQLVDGVTKLDRIRYGSAAQSEILRKMLVATSRDIRVLLIKLADRLHNARTWRFVLAKSAQVKARETLEIYSPLVHRLGMNMVKWEPEELSFKTLYPEIHVGIDRLVAERAPQRDVYLRDVISQIGEDLCRSGMKGTVSGRPKNHYSIYQKMIVRGEAFDEIFDLVTVRVLVESVKDYYAVLGVLYGHRNPTPGRFKDYIAMPKSNLYQLLHTTVVDPGGKPAEIQIRTLEVHECAEHGVATHWKYKQNPNVTDADGDRMASDEQANWLRTLVEMERETGDPKEFLDSLRYEIAGDEVYIFTSKGKVVVLPARSTPADFAYAVHAEVGHHTVGAKVNSRLVSLDTCLESGETVEVVTSKSGKADPSCGWLAFVVSLRARSRIKSWLSKERREEATEDGKEALVRAIRKQGLPLQRFMNHESILSMANSLGYPDVSALYAAVGESQISPQNVVSELVESLGGGDGTEETLPEGIIPGLTRPSPQIGSGSGISIAGMDAKDIWVKLTKCCTLVLGNEVVGFITRGQGVSVHLASCHSAVRLKELQPERFVDMKWTEGVSGQVFRMWIQVRALDRAGLLSDLTKVMNDHRVNLVSASVNTPADQVSVVRFSFEMADMGHLDAVLAALRRVDSVFEAARLTGKNGV